MRGNRVDFAAKICDVLSSIQVWWKMTKTVATTSEATKRLNTFEASSFNAIEKAYEHQFPISPFELFRQLPLHLCLLQMLENESR